MSLGQTIQSEFPNIVLEAASDPLYDTLIVKKDGIKNLCAQLKNDQKYSFDLLADLFAVDYLGWEDKPFRFEVVYNLYSVKSKQRMMLKTSVDENDAVLDSITSIWPAANWYEREVWDMFGVRFTGHPNPKRILMYEEFQGHALRKDYPYNRRQPLIGPKN